jgi:Holliday junction resolvase RusA-like endonuclease
VHTSGNVVRIILLGKPAPQGSHRIERGRIKEDNRRTVGWREVIADVCTTNLPTDWAPLDGPLEVWLAFFFDPPRHAKPGDYPTTRATYDMDKLYRALGDGLTDGGVIVDDSRFIDAHVKKRYVWPGEGEARAEVIVCPVTSPG